MSITDTDKLRARVATLDKLLDDFDGQLDELLAKSLPETLLGLDTLQQAKLQVTIPYLVYDLIIIYLKTKGVDPRTHPVFRELERVKGYIEKVSKAEKHESEQRRMSIDKAVANRFIKHAIAQAVRAPDQSSQPADQEPAPGPSGIQVHPVPAGAVTKMLARAEWEKQVQEAEEEEEELEVFDEAEDCAEAGADVEMTDGKTPAPVPLPEGKGETNTSSESHSATAKKKKKKSKKAKLPLTGGEGSSSNNSQAPPPQPEVHTTVDPTTKNPSTKEKGKKRPFPSETPAGGSEDPAAVPGAVSTLSKYKKRKRNKKSSTAAGVEADATSSLSQSRSQSRDVSAVSTPQATTLPLPGIETDSAVTGVVQKPKKWKKKKKGVQQAAADAGTQS